MTGWRTGMVALAMASGAWAGAARAQDAADGRSWAEYRAELQQVLASENQAQGTNAAQGTGNAAARSISSCKFFQPSPERVPAQDCMGCHGMHVTHPVEVDYESARFRGRTDLRPAEEVVRRGVFLADGKVACVTCHDPASRWAYHLALPPGALVRPAVNTRDPSTYERRPTPVRAEVLPAGTSVSPTPLCKVCHTLGD